MSSALKHALNHPLVMTSMLAVIASYACLSLEWAFFVTKPSMLDYLDWWQKSKVLVSAPLPLALIAVALNVILFYPLSQIPRWFKKQGDCDYNHFFLLIPVFIVSVSEFILIDNFTYTVFGIGVSTFTGYGRLMHTAVFIGLVHYNFKLVGSLFEDSARLRRLFRPAVIIGFSLLSLSVVAIFFLPGNTNTSFLASVVKTTSKPSKLYNILIFSSDGVDAKNMSAYGYNRPTTPFIESLLNESLQFENHFSNSAKTTGSVGALLSAKHPTTTKVIFRPDIFMGIDAFQHFPGFLRQFGYSNGDISIRHYTDAYDLNMRESFHFANGRNLEDEELPLPAFFRQKQNEASFFLETVYERISSRLLHLFSIRTMFNSYLAVTQPDREASSTSDSERMKIAKQFVRNTDEPFFLHVHLLNTHGRYFHASNTSFTGSREQDQPWDIDFYDNAILGYDNFTREIVELLRERSQLDNTILILNTDHGFMWSYNHMLPLIIRFPHGEHKGVVKTNSERIDIVPTIVDYLELDIPEWMEGESLLGPGKSSMEPIYVVNRSDTLRRNGWTMVGRPEPPFYTLGFLHAIYCNRNFNLDLIKNEFTHETIAEHSEPCDENDFPSHQMIRQRMVDYLDQQEYDISSLAIPK